jgi:hypothetical protein
MTAALLIGLVLAIAVGVLLSWTGLDRDRALYPVVVIVVASYYLLFAVLGQSPRSLLLEAAPFLVFVGLAIVGFRSSLWLVVAALALHGLFDGVHGLVIANPGVPRWWPAFCAAYDLAAAGFLAVLLLRRRIKVRADSAPG